MSRQRDIHVYIDWTEKDSPVYMGILHSELIRGKEVFSFESGEAWLKHPEFQFLDPDLGQFKGYQYLKENKANFGLFLDSSPDRWGRLLMRRREAMIAKSENRPAKTLTDTDYLLGVYDGNRMGSLRFKTNLSEDFLDNNKSMATPPWSTIRELEYASLQLERVDAPEDPEYNNWLRMLFAPGSSLGGARPKSNVVDNNGDLWIAKFPSNLDTRDMGAWEAVTAELAKACGIEVAQWKSQKLSGAYHTFFTKRFDRSTEGKRVYFASAMTLLGYTDGTDASHGTSYLELAEFITLRGCNVQYNLEQLWRRIVFNIGVSNCDDHLRNHGFILTPKGWILSPAYDVNPDEFGNGLKLNIDDNDNSLDFDLALSVAKYFGLSTAKASEILSAICTKIKDWPKIATKYKISRSEQEMMKNAFKI
jgi:serine/threonine-protein kinase HipA